MGTEADDSRKKVQDSIKLLIEGHESLRMNHPKQSNVTIFMVPHTLRNLNPTAYTPRIASIGPLHKHLRAIEDHKVSFMYGLFSPTMKSTKKSIEKLTDNCVQAVLGVLTRAKACYAPSLTNYEDFELAEMMVIDGCFILELLYKLKIKEGDPFFDNILVMHVVKHDLMLLENQMPFFILEILFSITLKPISNSTSLTDLVFYFFEDMNILTTGKLTTIDATVAPCHILGLLQSCFRPKATTPTQVPHISYSATEIGDAGVTFKAQNNKDYLLAVEFIQPSLIPGLGSLFFRETCFKIPVLCIKDSTPSLLRNLIAYEQCYPSSHHYVTSFAFLMDKLIDSKDDVSLLVRSNVLQQNLGAIEDVTNLFNNICKGIVLRDFYYSEEWKKLNEYCDSCWPRILVSLRHVYRSTTWKTLTVIGASVLFTLTLLQTIYSVRTV